MPRYHLVRVGVLGHVGRFFTPEAVEYPRCSRVVVRTDRGLETGEVLGPAEEIPRRLSDGTLLRRMTVSDDLIEARLRQDREEAIAACARRVEELGSSALLVDVEPLFDGSALYFYFLGDVTPELDAATNDLAKVYASQARLEQFAETVEHGCGPACGTESADGCTSCATGCALAGSCGSA